MDYMKIAAFGVDFFQSRPAGAMYALIKVKPETIASNVRLPSTLSTPICFHHFADIWQHIPYTDLPFDAFRLEEFKETFANSIASRPFVADNLRAKLESLIKEHISDFVVFATTTNQNEPLFILYSTIEAVNFSHKTGHGKKATTELGSWF